MLNISLRPTWISLSSGKWKETIILILFDIFLFSTRATHYWLFIWTKKYDCYTFKWNTIDYVVQHGSWARLVLSSWSIISSMTTYGPSRSRIWNIVPGRKTASYSLGMIEKLWISMAVLALMSNLHWNPSRSNTNQSKYYSDNSTYLSKVDWLDYLMSSMWMPDTSYKLLVDEHRV